MRSLGKQYSELPSSSPVLVVMVFSTATKLPAYAWVQESQTDVSMVMYSGIQVQCAGLLDDVHIRSSRPQSGGGLRRNVVDLKLNVIDAKGYPILDDPIVKGLYYGGSNLEDFYFGIYAIDRQWLNLDVRSGACYGHFSVDNEVSWGEVDGIQTISLIDMLLSNESIVGATAEVIPDTFFIYNPWFTANFFLKAYGQVPRIKVLNAFPSFSIKNFAASIGGTVRTAYTNASATIVLEDNTTDSSLLLQVVSIGGTVRIRMNDGEVIAGTLSYNSGAHTITLTVTARNTYYNNVTAYNDSLDGRSPDQWGTTPSYSTVLFSPFQTVIPNAKELILDQNGYLQADIQFFDPANATDKSYTVTNCVAKIQGLLSERKDVVIHSFWPDDRFPNWHNQGSISGFYNNTSNSAYLPTNQTPIWGIAAFQFLKFRTATQKIKLYFNDPSVSVAGSGAVGAPWSLVHIEPASIDKSCYIRNGYSKFDVNNVYVEGEGKLIKVPSANITITQSGTFYGLAGLTKIAFTEVPLDMGIGAKNNLVYVDALYKTGATTDSRAEVILREIIKEDPTLTTMLGSTLTTPQTENYLPFIGWIARTETKLTDIIDRVCYQCGITLKWVRGKIEIEVTGQNNNIERDYTAGTPVLQTDPPAGTYVEPLVTATDGDEMLENTAGLRIGNLRTFKYTTEAMQEYVPIYIRATYGGWEDPYYTAVISSSNRNIKPFERLVEYHFDLINDASSFTNAVGKSLSIGHPSGYALAQRAITTDMSLQGCRWEAMNPIVFNNFPLVSTRDLTNASYRADTGAILYPKRADGKRYLMGALCVVEDVTYEFNVRNPVVKLYARNSQTFITPSGLSIYSPPGPPTSIPVVPIDPNVPPNPGPGNGPNNVIVVPPGGGGSDWLMPEIITPNPVSFTRIDDLTTQNKTFTITVDSGWLFNKGWAYNLFVDDGSGAGAEDFGSVVGASISGGTSGSFPDKTSGAYVPPVYTVTVSVNYLFFSTSSESTYSKNLNLTMHKRWMEGETPVDSLVALAPIVVTRKDVTGVDGT